jgi:RHS repeat-associated protein
VGIDGHLAATQPDAGTPALQIVNPGGDVVATVPDQVPTSGNPAGASASAYFESSEFGLRRIGANASSRYAWLGAHRRSADALAGVVLMGVRLYNPGTGRFLTVDPVPGGNENAYNYPNDPINKFDLDGRWSLWKKAALKALSAFKGAAPWTLRAGCATTGLGAWLCTAVVGGLLGMVVDLLRARIESGRWPSKTSAAISFALGAALAIGGKWWNKFRPSLVNAGYRLLGSVKSLLRRVGLGGLATAVGTYAAGGLTIAAGVRLSER